MEHMFTTDELMLCVLSQLVVSNSCDTPMDCSLPGSSVHGDSLGKNTGVGCHALLQGIFSTQGSNPGLNLTLQVDSFFFFFHRALVILLLGRCKGAEIEEKII